MKEEQVTLTVRHEKALDLLKRNGYAIANSPEEKRILGDLAAAGFAWDDGAFFVYAADPWARGLSLSGRPGITSNVGVFVFLPGRTQVLVPLFHSTRRNGVVPAGADVVTLHV